MTPLEMFPSLAVGAAANAGGRDADLAPVMEILPALERSAWAEDDGRTGAGASVALLREARILQTLAEATPAHIARVLALVATVNLSAARLLEGHVNAVRLVELYGTARQFSRVRSGIAAGTLLGVWGADSERPVQCPAEDGTLVGAKSRASGLGDVSHALISVGSGESIRLALVDVGDASRQDPSTWKMLGMRATRSGDYDFDGARVAEWIGPPGVYFKEPHFIGGVWRIAAIQAGATIGLLQAAAADLERRGRFEAEAQIARLTTASLDTLAAWELVLRAARMVRGNGQPEPSEAIVALSAGTRLQTERCAQSAIAAVEQSIGLVHFDARSDTGRIARDLAIYLRQAARDALLQRAGRELLNGTRPLSGWLR